MEVSGLVGVSPLFVLGNGKGERGVEHGVHHVNEWHVGNYGAEQVRTHVDDCAHQKAAGRTAFDGYARRVAVFCGCQMLDGGDEIGEGVALYQHLSCVVPGLAKVGAAADVSVGHDYAAIQKTEAVGTKTDGQRVAVGTVAVDVERIVARLVHVLAVDERNGNQDAVRSRRVHSLAGIERAVDASGNLNLLQQGRSFVGHVVFIDRTRRDQGLVSVAESLRFKYAVDVRLGAVGGLGKVDFAGRGGLGAVAGEAP